MRETDAVWRTLADEALQSHRDWKNAGDLAWKAGVGEKLSYKALQRLASIGAITRHRGGGFGVTDPERITTLLAAARSLREARHTTFDAARTFIASAPEYAIGGTRAAVHYLGGRNVVASHAPAIVYFPIGTQLDSLPQGDGALILTATPHTLSRWYDGFTSPAQTYADLFAQPGWQASEFRRSLWRHWFGVDDWEQAESSRA